MNNNENNDPYRINDNYVKKVKLVLKKMGLKLAFIGPTYQPKEETKNLIREWINKIERNDRLSRKDK